MILQIIYGLLSLLKRKKINLADYATKVDYGTLNKYQRKAMDNILMACEMGAAGAEIPRLTQREFDEVVSHIGLHFGSDDICKNIALKRGDDAVVNLEVYKQAKEHKAKLDKWIDSAISKLNEGTTEYKLEQIAKCIADHARYSYGSSNPLELLGEGAMCGAYAMLFYKMATRIAVETFICYGYAEAGDTVGAHAWNMVALPAGTRFYDICFYDSTCRSGKWLGSPDGWGRSYSLNGKSALQNRG